MNTVIDNPDNPVRGWRIALFSLFLSLIGVGFSQITGGEAPVISKTNSHPLDNVSGTFREIDRHFQENDKGPVLQWIERTRTESKLASHCIVLVKEKGSNADLIIPEMADFLRSSGYQVTTDSAAVKLPKELLGLRFEAKQDCVMVHIGII